MVWRENSRGSIEAGKLADFVVLNADLLTVPDDQLKDLHPLATYVGVLLNLVLPKGKSAEEESAAVVAATQPDA